MGSWRWNAKCKEKVNLTIELYEQNSLNKSFFIPINEDNKLHYKICKETMHDQL